MGPFFLFRGFRCLLTQNTIKTMWRLLPAKGSWQTAGVVPDACDRRAFRHSCQGRSQLELEFLWGSSKQTCRANLASVWGRGFAWEHFPYCFFSFFSFHGFKPLTMLRDLVRLKGLKKPGFHQTTQSLGNSRCDVHYHQLCISNLQLLATTCLKINPVQPMFSRNPLMFSLLHSRRICELQDVFDPQRGTECQCQWDFWRYMAPVAAMHPGTQKGEKMQIQIHQYIFIHIYIYELYVYM